MPRMHLFKTKKWATGSAGKSGSADDASVSSPEAKKRRVGGSSSEEPASSASVPPTTGAEVLAEVPEERRSSTVPACALKLAIPHGCPSSSLPGASNNIARTQALLTWGQKIEPGIKRSRMRQILHTFRVNRNLQDTCPVYVASGTSETKA